MRQQTPTKRFNEKHYGVGEIAERGDVSGEIAGVGLQMLELSSLRAIAT
jgi:hypothetical protein